MTFTEARKKQLIEKIIGPVMAEKKLSLKRNRDGIWVWRKNLDGIMEEVNLCDQDGRLSIEIGSRKLGVEPASGRILLETLEHQRTEWVEWEYWVYGQGAGVYENILLDMRDILIKHCDAVLEKNAEEIRKALPNGTHFEQLREHCEELAAEYCGKLGTRGKNIVEICETIEEQIKMWRDRPLEEVEDDLVGYAALLESELLRQYGGIRRVNRKKEEILLVELGFGIDKSHMNVLQDIFKVWKEREKFGPLWKKKMAEFQEKNRQEQMKVCDTYFLCKPINEINAEDIPEMICQWKEFNLVFDRAMTKAVELLQENPFVGEFFDGELMEQMVGMDKEFYAAHSSELKAIAKDALKKSETHDWLYEEAQFEFVNKVYSISKKIKKWE